MRRIDDVERNAAHPRGVLGGLAIGAVIGDEDQRCALEIGILEGPRKDDHRRDFGEIGLDHAAHNHYKSSRLSAEPGLVEGFFSTANDDDALTLDLVADG